MGGKHGQRLCPALCDGDGGPSPVRLPTQRARDKGTAAEADEAVTQGLVSQTSDETGLFLSEMKTQRPRP